MNSAARSPIITVVVCVFAETIDGMIEASATRSPSTPRTRNWESTTARSSMPILQDPA